MSRKEIETLLKSLCEQAENRMQAVGIHIEFSIHDCKSEDGIDLRVKQDGRTSKPLHIWSEGQIFVPSMYELLFVFICINLAAMHDVYEAMQHASYKAGSEAGFDFNKSGSEVKH